MSLSSLLLLSFISNIFKDIINWIIFFVCRIAEGIKERDKRMVTQALSQISTMRDNTYHLIRHMWNDVQEDWPFYSEQDRQMLKW